MYGIELFANCESFYKEKLRVVFNNIVRYVFDRRRFDSISDFVVRIFEIDFYKLLKMRTILFLHKIVYSKSPGYLYQRLRFARSNRGLIIIPPRHCYELSTRQFFLYSIKLWNALPHCLQTISSSNSFKVSLLAHLKTNLWFLYFISLLFSFQKSSPFSYFHFLF